MSRRRDPLTTRSGITHARREGDAINHQQNLCGTSRPAATQLPVDGETFRGLQRLTNWPMCSKCDRKLTALDAEAAKTAPATEVQHA